MTLGEQCCNSCSYVGSHNRAQFLPIFEWSPIEKLHGLAIYINRTDHCIVLAVLMVTFGLPVRKQNLSSCSR